MYVEWVYITPRFSTTLVGSTRKRFLYLCSLQMWRGCVARIHRDGGGGGGAEIQIPTAATSSSRSPGNHNVLTRELRRDSSSFDPVPAAE